jgi:hypothetical protein
MYKSKISSEVKKIFLFIILLQYIIPFLGHFIFIEDYKNTFKIGEPSVILFIIPLVVISAFYVDKLLPKFTSDFNLLFLVQKIINSNSINMLLSIAYLILSIKFYSEYSIDFRHHNELSAAKYVIMIFSLHAYFKAYMLILLVSKPKLNYKKRTILFFIISSYSLTIISSFDIIFIFVGVLLFFERKNWLFVKDMFTVSDQIMKLVYLPIIVLPILGVIFVGIANKIGVENTMNLSSNSDFLLSTFKLILIRQSTWYSSTLVSGKLFLHDVYFAWKPFLALFANMINRFAILFNFEPMQTPEIWSINRLNYINLFVQDYGERTGTSPGIIASIFYLPIFPLNFIFIILYLVFVLRMLSYQININLGFLNIFGYVIFFFFIFSLFDSPIDYINFISPSFIYIITLISGFSYLK